MDRPEKRGPYAKTAARRAEILRAARASFAERGYEGSTLRDIAARAGISAVGMLHHFSSKEELLTAVLAQRDADEQKRGTSLTDPVGPRMSAAAFLAGVLREHQKAPELMRLWTELAVAASRPGHPEHAYFVERYAEARATIVADLDKRQAGGNLPPQLDPDSTAALLLAVLDGLQTQWLLDPDLDIVGLLQRFLDLIDRTDS
ncbi:TetR/AcrR family transcriptional regulator [Streptomyces sp. YIM S03343]